MPHLLTLAPLLLEVPAPATMPAWMGYVGLFALIVSVLSVTLNVILALRKESREDGQTVSQRLKKIEAKTSELDTQRQGEVQARERLGETLLREYGQFKADIERRTLHLEGNAAEVQGLRERMVRIETELQSLPRIESSVKEMNSLLLKFLNDK